MRQYIDLVKHILDTGTRKENRTGVDTISTFGEYYEHDMTRGFPLLTTKAISWKNIVIENLWFISGQTDISLLQRHGCKFWDAWADEHGKVPSAYGSFWANFPVSSEPEQIPPRFTSTAEYKPPTFAELPVSTNHAVCGEIRKSTTSGPFRVCQFVGHDYAGRATFDVQFLDSGYIARFVRKDVIDNGELRDPYARSVCGIGYYGEFEDRGGLTKNLIKTWRHMLERCYDPSCKEYPYYGGKSVTVCDRWHNFSEFVCDVKSLPNWVNKRSHPEDYSIDKDYFSSSTYSPETCVWLSKEDNRLYACGTSVEVQTPGGVQFIALSISEAASATGIGTWRVGEALKTGKICDGYRFSSTTGHPYRRPLPNNQIRWVLDEMRRNPMSRRMVVSAWAPENAQTSKLPPCHCLFVFNVQNDVDGTRRLCLHLTQRSCDVALGVPYNLAGYAFLLQMFAQMAGLQVGIFGHTLIDAHVYTSKPDGSKSEYDHVPGLVEQCSRYPKPLPKLIIDPHIRDLRDIEALMDPKLTTDEVMSHFALEGYDPHPTIKFKVAV